MTAQAVLFARTFVVGLAVAAPVGAMGVLCIQRVLARGFRAGLATGLGIATADGIYGGVAAFGVAAVSAALVAAQSPLRIVGGLVLAWLGWQAMTAPVTHDAAKVRVAGGHTGMYASAVGLTLTNPMTIMAFAAIFASAGLTAQPGVANAITATAGVACGSLAWWIALSAVVAAVRHAVSDSAVHWVNRISGAIVAGFGLIAVVAGVMAWR